MHEIDFLPAEYRQRHERRRAQPWQMVVVVVFATLLAGSAAGQWLIGRQSAAELQALQAQHDEALTHAAELQRLAGDLDRARATADLYAYLRHPWPRTQILDALLRPLPEGIAFRELEIAHEIPPSTAMLIAPADPLAAEKELAALPPARRDLRRLRDEFDARQTVVSLSGQTDEISKLHLYLGKLASTGFFSQVGLPQIESGGDTDEGRPRFTVRLVVRPGYGQTGGPGGNAIGAGFADARVVSDASIVPSAEH